MYQHGDVGAAPSTEILGVLGEDANHRIDHAHRKERKTHDHGEEQASDARLDMARSEQVENRDEMTATRMTKKEDANFHEREAIFR